MSDFETDLARIPLRPAPAEWREPILRAARAAAPESPAAAWWQRWLTPQPFALAAVWLVIGALRLVTPEDGSRTGAPASVAELRARVRTQRELLAELLDPSAPMAAEPPAPHGAAMSRRRSRLPEP